MKAGGINGTENIPWERNVKHVHLSWDHVPVQFLPEFDLEMTDVKVTYPGLG